MAEEPVPLLGLGSHLELHEIPVQILAVRNPRQIEEPLPERPPGVRPLHGTAIGIAPSVRCIIERPRVNDGPIQKVRPWIVSIGIGVKNIDDAELSDCEDQVVRQPCTGQLVQTGFDLFLRAAQS